MAKKKVTEQPAPPEEQIPDSTDTITDNSEVHEVQLTDTGGNDTHPDGDSPAEDDAPKKNYAEGSEVADGAPLCSSVITPLAEREQAGSGDLNGLLVSAGADEYDTSVLDGEDTPVAGNTQINDVLTGDVPTGEFPQNFKGSRTVQQKKAAEASHEESTDSTDVNATLGFTPGVLTIDARGEVESEQYQEDTIWHDIRNAYRTRRILTGYLGGLEQTEDGKTLIIVEYKGFRVVIPMKEMMISLGRRPSGTAYADLMRRQNQILSTMMGAEIDFIVRGIENKSRSIVASRKEAMLKKRQIFYLNKDDTGTYRIYDGRLVQARVTAVAEKVIRVEVFGVECAIMARDLAWDWMGDAHERFSVGDRIVVRILEVQRNGLEDITIRADVKSVSSKTDLDNLKKCRIQGKYAGRVTDIHKGVVFVRLTNGVNAIAHSCFDRRMPGKKDDVSFAVTHIDDEQGVAVGIITRIIKQHL